jgi:hypothetical protein
MFGLDQDHSLRFTCIAICTSQSIIGLTICQHNGNCCMCFRLHVASQASVPRADKACLLACFDVKVTCRDSPFSFYIHKTPDPKSTDGR